MKFFYVMSMLASSEEAVDSHSESDSSSDSAIR